MLIIKSNCKKKLTYEEFCKHINSPSDQVSGEKYILKQLQEFEKSYNMESSTFFKEYCKGLLPDRFDYLKWAHLWKSYLNHHAPNSGGAR